MSEPVIVKLLNGDLLMAILLNDTDDTIVLNDPIAVRQVSVVTEGGMIEKTLTQPFCPFTHEREFSIDRRNVIYVKPLSPRIAQHYLHLIESFLREKNEDNNFGQMQIDNQPDESYYDDYVEDEHEEDEEAFFVIPDKATLH